MDVIQSLFKAYLQDATIFAVAHAIVALLVVVSLISFARWKFGAEPPPTIWQEFEIRSNFIHGLIGLFLIVGIAGTFLGLWDIASTLDQSPASLPPAGTAVDAAQHASDTVKVLLKGIAKAFPVGFVGLVLTLLMNVPAVVIEAYKRRKIEAFMTDVVDPLTKKLVQALEPVANLGTTLEKSLKPVIDRLATTLAPIAIFMEDQQHELVNAKTALIEAAEALKSSGQQISESVTGLKEMAETAHAALESAKNLSNGIRTYFASITSKLDQATERATDAFENYDKSLGAMSDSVSEAADAFLTFPAQLRGDVTAALVSSYNEASAAREEELKDLYARARNQFQANMVNAVSGVMFGLDQAKTELETLTSRMNNSTANAGNAINHLEEAWKVQADKFCEGITKQIDPGLRKELSTSSKSAIEALEEAARSGDVFAKSTKKTTADIDRLYREAGDRLTTAANHLGNRLAGMTREIESAAAGLQAAAERRQSRPPGRLRRFGRSVWAELTRPIRIIPRRKRR